MCFNEQISKQLHKCIFCCRFKVKVVCYGYGISLEWMTALELKSAKFNVHIFSSHYYCVFHYLKNKFLRSCQNKKSRITLLTWVTNLWIVLIRLSLFFSNFSGNSFINNRGVKKFGFGGQRTQDKNGQTNRWVACHNITILTKKRKISSLFYKMYPIRGSNIFWAAWI